MHPPSDIDLSEALSKAPEFLPKYTKYLFMDGH
jgi:hypothetical protein